MKNKMLALFFLSFLLVFCVCGCGSTGSSHDESVGSGEAEQTEPSSEPSLSVSFPNGTEAETDAQELDLTGLKDQDADKALEAIALLPQLKSVNLGCEKDGLSPKTALRFRDEYPDLDFSYHCTLFGKDSVLDEKRLILSETPPKKIALRAFFRRGELSERK